MEISIFQQSAEPNASTTRSEQDVEEELDYFPKNVEMSLVFERINNSIYFSLF